MSTCPIISPFLTFSADKMNKCANTIEKIDHIYSVFLKRNLLALRKFSTPTAALRQNLFCHKIWVIIYIVKERKSFPDITLHGGYNLYE